MAPMALARRPQLQPLEENLVDADDDERGYVPLGPASATNTPHFHLKPAKAPPTLRELARVCVLFCAWYACNFAYSITNKEALGLWPFPFSFGAIQLFVGLVYVSILWSPLPLYNRRSGWRSTTLRARPSFTRAHVREMLPAAALLAIGHTAATAAPAYGSVAFTNVVKTTETLFASVCLALVSREIFNPIVYATLVPVVFGVALATVSEIDFSWCTLCACGVSMNAFALYSIGAKRLLNHAPYKQDGAPSLYSALTIISFALLVPVSLLVEGPSIHAWWTQSSAAALAASGGLSSNPLSGRLVRLLTLTGLFNYLSNELAFCVLDLCSPLTYAVANTVKRVIVIVGSVLFFKTRVTPIGSLGASMAICGAFLYSLALSSTHDAHQARKLQHLSSRASAPILKAE